MKIVQTPVRFYPFVGGVEKYTLELSKALVLQGHEVTVVCANEPESKKNDDVDGVKVVRLDYRKKLANTNITLGFFKTLMSKDMDVIHTHIPTPWSADLSALASLLKRKPLFVTYHNDLVKGGGIEALIATIYNKTFLKLVFLRADKIIITQPRYLEFSKHLKAYKNKVVTIPLGVSKPVKTKVDRNQNQLFFLSVLDRHHEYKGLNVLLTALVEVKKQIPGIKLIVGGKGKLIVKYRKITKELDLSKNVKFVGYVPENELPKLYSSSAVFVLPSVNNLEGFGIVALEALSYGTPTITTDLAGSSIFIKRTKSGKIVPPNDVPELATAILSLLLNPEESHRMGLRGSKVVNDEFSWEKIASEVSDLYVGDSIE